MRAFVSGVSGEPVIRRRRATHPRLHRGLPPEALRRGKRAQGVEDPRDGRFTASGKRPLQVLPLELLRRGIASSVILSDFQQLPTCQRG